MALTSRSAAWLGACAGGLAVAAMLLLRVVAGVPALLDVLGSGLALMLPGPVFGSLIDALQEKGRPFLLLATALMLVVVSSLLAIFMARRTGPGVAGQPATGSGRRGPYLRRWLVAGLLLWVVTLPLVVVAQGGVRTAATYTTLGDWLLISALVQILLAMSRRGGAQPGVLGSRHLGVMTRRQFLASSGAVVGAASLGYLGARVIFAGASPALTSAPAGGARAALPAGITSTSDFYVVSKDLFGPPSIDPASWRLALAGRADDSIGYGELLALSDVDQVQTLECISNPVGGTLISNGSWRGVPLARLLQRVGVPAGTRTIIFNCADGYSESLPLEEAMAESTLVATRLDGKPLPALHGFPARILVPGHYGMKDPKWLTRISTSSGDYTGYWEAQGWNAAAVPHIFSRFDFPPGSARLEAGRAYLLSGVAFAGNIGIGLVQVSLDGGRHWVDADLERPLSSYAWTIWSLPWRPQAGIYTLTVRARDKRGRLQASPDTGTYPNGASGRQQIVVIAS